MWALTQSGEMVNLSAAATLVARSGRVVAQFAGEPREVAVAEYEGPGAMLQAAETFESIRAAIMLGETYWEWTQPSEPGQISGLSFLQLPESETPTH